MSKAGHSSVHIGCPQCDSTVNASVPSEFGIVDPDDDGENRLRGKETRCESCGYELEVYFY